MLNIPTSHTVHDAAPDPEYVPASHGRHVAFSDLYVPAEHDEQLVWPVSPWNLPFSHDTQLVCPVDCWYLPASQSSHDVDELKGCTVPPSHAAQLLWPVSLL